MLTLAEFLKLLPYVRPVLARRRILQWDLLGDALNDVYPVANWIWGGEGYYFYIGPRAAQKIVVAYQAGLLPMKEGRMPGSTGHAQAYIASRHRPPPYCDHGTRLVRGEDGKVILVMCDTPAVMLKFEWNANGQLEPRF